MFGKRLKQGPHSRASIAQITGKAMESGRQYSKARQRDAERGQWKGRRTAEIAPEEICKTLPSNAPDGFRGMFFSMDQVFARRQ